MNFKNYYEKLSVALLAAFILSNLIWGVLNDSNINEIDKLNKSVHYQDSIINELLIVDEKQDSIIDNMPEFLYPNPDTEWQN